MVRRTSLFFLFLLGCVVAQFAAREERRQKTARFWSTALSHYKRKPSGTYVAKSSKRRHKPTRRPHKHHAHTHKKRPKTTPTPTCRPVICTVSPWSSWSRCSLPCGNNGIQTRTRKVVAPELCGGICPYELLQTRSCNRYCQNGGTLLATHCLCLPRYGGNCCEQVHGQWSCWGDWGQCTSSCGQGTQRRMRTCDNPPPLSGGRPCHGVDLEKQHCNIAPCPVEGVWSSWQSWSQCSTSCGRGTQTRSRACTHPPASYAASDCVGVGSEKRPCVNQTPCPVDGSWSSWAAWSGCSVTCGQGTKSRERTCTNPPPHHGGAPCTGASVGVTQCSLAVCPGWSSWGPWGKCDKNCIRTRRRTCEVCPSKRRSRACNGVESETQKCDFDLCSEESQYLIIRHASHSDYVYTPRPTQHVRGGGNGGSGSGRDQRRKEVTR